MKLPIAALFAPIERLRETPAVGWLVSLVFAGFNLIREDLFTGAVLMVMISGALDYYLGRKIAKLKGSYNPLVAHAGAIGKISGVALIMLVRMFEWWAGQHLAIDSHGMISSAVGMSLFVVDLQSIQHHRESLGAKPIPVLSTLIQRIHERFDAAVGALLGVKPEQR